MMDLLFLVYPLFYTSCFCVIFIRSTGKTAASPSTAAMLNTITSEVVSFNTPPNETPINIVLINSGNTVPFTRPIMLSSTR